MSMYPDNYEVQAGNGGAYTELEVGENRIRVLSDPVVGWKYWTDANGNPRPLSSKPQKGDKPVRLEFGKLLPDGIKRVTKVSQFNAFKVYNYGSNKVEVFETDKTTILTPLLSIDRNPKWGNFREFDIVITRKGEGLDTVYSVMPDPKEAVSEVVKKADKETIVDLTLMFKDENPFVTDPNAPKTADSNNKDLPFD